MLVPRAIYRETVGFVVLPIDFRVNCFTGKSVQAKFFDTMWMSSCEILPHVKLRM